MKKKSIMRLVLMSTTSHLAIASVMMAANYVKQQEHN